FDILLDRYLLDSPTPAEQAELAELLQADTALRRAFADRFLLEVHLHKAFSSGAPTAVVAPAIPKRRRAIVGWVVAATVMLGVSLVVWAVTRPVPVSGHPVVSGEVRLDGIVVTELPDDKAFDVGSDAPAVVQLADGARAELAATSRAVIHPQRG